MIRLSNGSQEHRTNFNCGKKIGHAECVGCKEPFKDKREIFTFEGGVGEYCRRCWRKLIDAAEE